MHFDNLIFILLIAVAALFRLLASKAGNARKSEPPERSTSAPHTSNPVVRPPTDTDEERIRRFLEALGQPTSSKPPAPVAPRTDLPPRPLAPVQPPLAHLPIPTRLPRRAIAPIPTKQKIGDPPPIYSGTRKLPLQPAAESVFEVQRRPAPAEPLPVLAPATADAIVNQPETVAPGERIDIVALVNAPSGLRNAIILREIFGPPRSLQPLDLTGSA